MSNPMIGVVTVTYNSACFLPDFISSLADQSMEDYRVYCIDNHSADGTQELLTRIRDARWHVILNSENLGVATGNNQGIMQALKDGCEWILLLNNDTSFQSEFFAKLLSECIARRCSAAVPKIYYDIPAGQIWYAGGGFNKLKGYTGYHSSIGRRDNGEFDVARQVDYAPTCAMLISSGVFKKIGLMDESYFVYFDDTDFCWRMKQSRLSLVYCPSATIVHKVGGSTGGAKSRFAAYYISRNRMYFLRKHFGKATALAWSPIFLAFYVLRYVTLQWSFDCLKASIAGTLAFSSLEPETPVLPDQSE